MFQRWWSHFVAIESQRMMKLLGILPGLLHFVLLQSLQSLQSASFAWFQHVLGSFWRNSGDALHKSSPLRGSKAQSQWVPRSLDPQEQQEEQQWIQIRFQSKNKRKVQRINDFRLKKPSQVWQIHRFEQLERFQYKRVWVQLETCKHTFCHFCPASTCGT